MTINYERALKFQIPDVEQTYTERDVMLYALGIGMGNDISDAGQLRFVYEKDLHVVPTMAVVLGESFDWTYDPELGINQVMTLHGEEYLTVHKPLPTSGTVVGQSRIVDIVDKGEGRGALVMSERKLYNKGNGDLLATLKMTGFARADGGFGGPKRPTPAPHALPDRAPDHVCELPTYEQIALVYRLSGDWVRLHADPDVAKSAGFPKPIMHGLCSYGMACHAVLRTACGYDPAKLKSFDCRFTAPVFPGETFLVDIWIDGKIVSFRSRLKDRDVVAISNGRAELV
ncbi:MAG: MaoC family dehydratase N-terminal domain-containing protein [Rhodobiaceae bacterium]|nr:MaoC family dehydratase N-terminal domain-containing protein [Rhodobiaceae bacterium]MCC0054616.1 MaoC family dehydratase N-terminal domain-containing protein [Rhodobiaceae bacterium]